MTLAAALLHCVAHGNGLDCRPTTTAIIFFVIVWMMLVGFILLLSDR